MFSNSKVISPKVTKSRTRASLMAAVSSICVVVSSSAWAQSVNDEIIVTAQKREQSIKDVPMSVTAISGDVLSEQGIELVQDFAKKVPGFTYAESRVGTPIYTLRGVGFNDIALGGRPTVSVYHDEVAVPFAIETRGGFLDLERAEVLMGPQGTLFGQNATGGGINLIAAKPTDVFDGSLEFGYGSFDKITAGGHLSGPLSDTLKARIAVKHQSSSDWQESYIDDKTNGALNLTTGRLLVDWTPTDRFKLGVNLNGFIDKSESQAPALSGIFPGIAPVAGFIPGLLGVPNAPEDNRAADWTDSDYKKDNKFFQANVRMDYDLSDAFTITWLSSYSEYDEDQLVDVDAQAIIGLEQRTLGKIKSISQELRIAGDLSDRTFVTVGLNYADDETREFNFDDISQSTLGVATGLATFNLQNDQDIETIAVFGNVEYSLSDTVTASVGGRYTESTNDFTGCSRDSGDGTASSFFVNVLMLPPPGAGNCFSFDAATFSFPLIETQLKEDNFSWRVGLDWDATDRVKLYGNISRGYKAGGFPTLAATFAPQYDPTTQESLTAYEVGFKGNLTDSFNVTGAIYYYDYTDKQVLGFVNDPTFGPLLRLINVPDSAVKGAELQALWSPIEGLDINGSIAHVDSEVTGEFINQNAFGVTENFEGEAFPNAPKWQLNAGANYQFPLTEQLDGFVGINANHQSSTNSEFGESPELAIEGYTLVDLRAGIEGGDGAWELSGFVRNVGDEYYWTFASKTNDTFIRYTGQPRTYGINLKYNFGG